MHRKVRVLRLWVAMLAIAVLAMWEPAIALLMLVPVHECLGCCGGQVCTWCTNDLAADQYQIIVAGLTNQGCLDCANWNTTFIVDWDSTPAAENACEWVIGGLELGCSAIETRLRISDIGLGDVAVDAFVGCGTGAVSCIVGFRKVYSGAGGEIDCQLSEEALTVFTVSGSCVESSATCEVSAV